jgi:hypothetical protein
MAKKIPTISEIPDNLKVVFLIILDVKKVLIIIVIKIFQRENALSKVESSVKVPMCRFSVCGQNFPRGKFFLFANKNNGKENLKT